MIIILPLVKSTTQFYKFSFQDKDVISNIYLKKELFSTEPTNLEVEIKLNDKIQTELQG